MTAAHLSAAMDAIHKLLQIPPRPSNNLTASQADAIGCALDHLKYGSPADAAYTLAQAFPDIAEGKA